MASSFVNQTSTAAGAVPLGVLFAQVDQSEAPAAVALSVISGFVLALTLFPQHGNGLPILAYVLSDLQLLVSLWPAYTERVRAATVNANWTSIPSTASGSGSGGGGVSLETAEGLITNAAPVATLMNPSYSVVVSLWNLGGSTGSYFGALIVLLLFLVAHALFFFGSAMFVSLSPEAKLRRSLAFEKRRKKLNGAGEEQEGEEIEKERLTPLGFELRLAARISRFPAISLRMMVLLLTGFCFESVGLLTASSAAERNIFWGAVGVGCVIALLVAMSWYSRKRCGLVFHRNHFHRLGMHWSRSSVVMGPTGGAAGRAALRNPLSYPITSTTGSSDGYRQASYRQGLGAPVPLPTRLTTRINGGSHTADDDEDESIDSFGLTFSQVVLNLFVPVGFWNNPLPRAMLDAGSGLPTAPRWREEWELLAWELCVDPFTGRSTVFGIVALIRLLFVEMIFAMEYVPMDAALIVNAVFCWLYAAAVFFFQPFRFRFVGVLSAIQTVLIGGIFIATTSPSIGAKLSPQHAEPLVIAVCVISGIAAVVTVATAFAERSNLVDREMSFRRKVLRPLRAQLTATAGYDHNSVDYLDDDDDFGRSALLLQPSPRHDDEGAGRVLDRALLDRSRIQEEFLGPVSSSPAPQQELSRQQRQSAYYTPSELPPPPQSHLLPPPRQPGFHSTASPSPRRFPPSDDPDVQALLSAPLLQAPAEPRDELPLDELGRPVVVDSNPLSQHGSPHSPFFRDPAVLNEPLDLPPSAEPDVSTIAPSASSFYCPHRNDDTLGYVLRDEVTFVNGEIPTVRPYSTPKRSGSSGKDARNRQRLVRKVDLYFEGMDNMSVPSDATDDEEMEDVLDPPSHHYHHHPQQHSNTCNSSRPSTAAPPYPTHHGGGGGGRRRGGGGGEILPYSPSQRSASHY